MKKLLIVAALTFAGFFIVNNFNGHDELKVVANNTTLPFKIAMLAAKEPEAQIAMPVRTVKVKSVADTWNAPRSNERTHQGQDIFAPRGTAVYSATEGYVFRIGQNSLGGNNIWIAGAGGRFYYYAHLDKFAENLKQGDYATTETIIGYVGTTGNAKDTPPHLHFGVYTSTGAINPLPLLTD
ncbi:MAG TPA: M23 family metallopeptidase [Pyrinomonadaceae bacterium]|jgi:murein DD-endopeptidase MepM/ murein hydrolase activator NlpD